MNSSKRWLLALKRGWVITMVFSFGLFVATILITGQVVVVDAIKQSSSSQTTPDKKVDKPPEYYGVPNEQGGIDHHITLFDSISVSDSITASSENKKVTTIPWYQNLFPQD